MAYPPTCFSSACLTLSCPFTAGFTPWRRVGGVLARAGGLWEGVPWHHEDQPTPTPVLEAAEQLAWGKQGLNEMQNEMQLNLKKKL